MVAGATEFYNAVPEDQLNPNHKEDFESLLSLFVKDRSEKADSSVINAENLLKLGFEVSETFYGTAYTRGTDTIYPDSIYKTRRKQFALRDMQKYKAWVKGLEVEIKEYLAANQK